MELEERDYIVTYGAMYFNLHSQTVQRQNFK